VLGGVWLVFYWYLLLEVKITLEIFNLKGKIYLCLILSKQELRDYSISRFATNAKLGLYTH
jgi:hypothetical protein